MAKAKTKGAKKSPAKKNKATKAVKKKNTPAASRKRIAAGTAKASGRERHPGRRAEASPKVVSKHEDLITKQQAAIKAAEQKVQEEKNKLAERVDTAAADGVTTTKLCEILGLSRQMIYKMVAERVDGKKLNQKSSGSNTKPKAAKAKSTKPKAKTKKPAKSKATKSSKPASKPKVTKSASKSPTKPNGRKVDIAAFGKKTKSEDEDKVSGKKAARPKRAAHPKRKKAPAAA